MWGADIVVCFEDLEFKKISVQGFLSADRRCPLIIVLPWVLAEFYFNRVLQRLYTGTCIILQKTINGFLCLLIVFLKSKTHQLKLKDVIKLNRNLTVTDRDEIVAKRYWLKSIYIIKAVFNSSSQQTVTITEVLKEF